MPATTTPTDLRELLRPRVERGAALLDSVEPYWWERIEERLQMDDRTSCVLGQMYGDYSDGVAGLTRDLPLNAKRAWAQRHGFFATTGCVAEYPTLDALWLEAIEARRQS